MGIEQVKMTEEHVEEMQYRLKRSISAQGMTLTTSGDGITILTYADEISIRVTMTQEEAMFLAMQLMDLVMVEVD